MYYANVCKLNICPPKGATTSRTPMQILGRLKPKSFEKWFHRRTSRFKAPSMSRLNSILQLHVCKETAFASTCKSVRQCEFYHENLPEVIVRVKLKHFHVSYLHQSNGQTMNFLELRTLLPACELTNSTTLIVIEKRSERSLADLIAATRQVKPIN